jgi:hypothetical protein
VPRLPTFALKAAPGTPEEACGGRRTAAPRWQEATNRDGTVQEALFLVIPPVYCTID